MPSFLYSFFFDLCFFEIRWETINTELNKTCIYYFWPVFIAYLYAWFLFYPRWINMQKGHWFVNIDTLTASTANKELPGQYFKRVEQNLFRRKLGYLCLPFHRLSQGCHRPSQGGHKPSQGGILWKEGNS